MWTKVNLNPQIGLQINHLISQNTWTLGFLSQIRAMAHCKRLLIFTLVKNVEQMSSTVNGMAMELMSYVKLRNANILFFNKCIFW